MNRNDSGAVVPSAPSSSAGSDPSAVVPGVPGGGGGGGEGSSFAPSETGMPRSPIRSPTRSPRRNQTSLKSASFNDYIGSGTSGGGGSGATSSSAKQQQQQQQGQAGMLPPRSPRKSRSSNSNSRAGSLSPASTRSSSRHRGSDLMNKPLLEEVSVHLSLPTIHGAHNNSKAASFSCATASAGWRCAGCSHENHSALSQECSVCGMKRSIMELLSDSASSLGDESDSFGVDDDILSLNNSFSITDNQQDNQYVGKECMSSMPVLGYHNSFQNSFSDQTAASVRSTYTTQTAAHIGRTGRRSASSSSSNINRRRYRDSGGDDGTASLVSRRSFRDWSGNESLKPWKCNACTYVNENSMLLSCEICACPKGATHAPQLARTATAPPVLQHGGAGGQQNNDSGQATGSGITNGSTIAEAAAAATAEASQVDDDLRFVQQEHMRELFDLQREIVASFQQPQSQTQNSADGAAEQQTLPAPSADSGGDGALDDVQEMRKEIGSVGASLDGLQRKHHCYDVDDGSDDEDDEQLLEDLLEQQRQILSDFKRNRSFPTSDYDSKPASAASTAGGGGNSSASAPASSQAAAASSLSSNAEMFGRDTSNSPNASLRSNVNLEESMKAAGGSLRPTDLCMPILWGDDLGSLKVGGPK